MLRYPSLRAGLNTMDPIEQAAAWSRDLEGADPAVIVRWSVERFGEGLVIGSSFGRDGLVVIDLARRWRPDIPVLFLETGYHFPETLTFRDRLRAEWGLNIVDVRAVQSVAEQDAAYGAQLYARDPDACCNLRKVEPLQRALAGRRAWLTGVRRDQHSGRGTTPVVEWQELAAGAGGLFKITPVVGWTRARIDDYSREHHLPSHPLWAQGYPSVGCAPCTRPVGPTGSERDGRWAGTGKTECGINVMGIRRAASVPSPGGPPTGGSADGS